MLPPLQSNMLTQVLPQHFPQHSFPYGAIFRGGIAPLTADRIVMQLTEEFLSIIGATSTAKELRLSYNQEQHIREQRGAEAQAVIDGIPNALLQLRYVNRKRRVRREHTVIGSPGPGRPLLVGFKFVPSGRARSKNDEAWVTTAYFLNGLELRKKIRKHRLRPVERFQQP